MNISQLHIDYYLKTVQSTKNLSIKTITAYHSDLLDFFRFAQKQQGNDSSILINYVHTLQAVRGLKDSTISRKLIVLKSFFSFLVKNGQIGVDYFAISDFRFKQEKHLPRTITIEESKRLLACSEQRKRAADITHMWLEVRNLALIDILISTGIRIAEAANIAVEDIVISERLVLIHGKGRRQRLIYISCEQTWRNLCEWIEMRSKLHLATNKVFVNRYGNPIGIHGIEYIFASLKKRAGINSNATPHYLRHTFATNLLSNGADLRSVQELLGHASVSTTEIYTEVSAIRKKQVLDMFNYRNMF